LVAKVEVFTAEPPCAGCVELLETSDFLESKYGEIRGMLRDLEEHMIGFSGWKESKVKEIDEVSESVKKPLGIV